jgi:trehalose 6-phosphate phosphatase
VGSAGALDPLREHPDLTAILFDFDGTLSEIVAHPSLVEIAAGAREMLAVAVARFALVAVVSGRPREEVASLVGVPAVEIQGTYGLSGELPTEVTTVARDVASRVEGAWVEPKGASVAVHYRAASDPDAARSLLTEALSHFAASNDLELVDGKMVVELMPRGAGRKGAVVERLVRQHSVRLAMYAGDDVADLEAFAGLRRMVAEGTLDASVCVAVDGPETPEQLVAAADLVAGGPTDLVRLVREIL